MSIYSKIVHFNETAKTAALSSKFGIATEH